MTKLEKQFNKLINNPTIPGNLTIKLYNFLYINGGFIAHFDRTGFHAARFCTLAAFDRTIKLISIDKKAKHLLKGISSDQLGTARYKIASLEASILNQKVKIMNYHIKQLQSKFTKHLVA